MGTSHGMITFLTTMYILPTTACCCHVGVCLWTLGTACCLGSVIVCHGLATDDSLDTPTGGIVDELLFTTIFTL